MVQSLRTQDVLGVKAESVDKMRKLSMDFQVFDREREGVLSSSNNFSSSE